jgi:C4-dicarboxylate transporter DctQ subunit
VLRALDHIVGLLTRAAGVLAAVLIVFMTLVVGYGVGARYLFDNPQVWIDELVSYLVVLLVMTAAAEVLRRGEHVEIDLLVARLGPGPARWVGIGGMLAVLVVSAVLIASGLEMIAFSREMQIRSVGYLSVLIWIPQSALPLGFTLLALAALNRMLRLLTGLETVARSTPPPHP